MKKNIALLLSIIALVLLIIFLRVNINKEHNSLKGQFISDAIYGYDLNTENLTVNGLIVKNQEVYYLLMEVVDNENSLYSYKLKKLNIYTNEITEINNLTTSNSYCSLREEKVYCISSDYFKVYNLNLDELFSSAVKEENYTSNYAPYKDIYIKIDGQNIYLLRHDTEELYRFITYETTLLYEDYFVTHTNTYLLFLDEAGSHLLYDVNEDSLTEIGIANYYLYSQGWFFITEEEFQVYDLINNKIESYENFTQEDYYYTGTLNDNTFYLYDIINNQLNIENINNATLQKIDTNIFSQENPLSTIIYDQNYLYIFILQDKNNFYVIDLNNLNLETENLQEYSDNLEREISTKINELEKNYLININIKEDAIIEFPDFSAEVLINNEQILESLTKIETILSKYDLTFFQSFYDKDYAGLNLYLTGPLTPSDYDTQVSNPAAYSLIFNNEYMIVIDLTESNIEELLCHELLHNLENNLNNQGIYLFNDWDTFNPKNFTYNYSYTEEASYDYTLYENDINNVYFIDYYSHTYATEDRARVFENICACENSSLVNDYPHLYAKALYLKEEIIKYYPSLENTTLFASLN